MGSAHQFASPQDELVIIMKNNTTISKNLIHETKFIDPRSGQILKTGTDPVSTVRAFRENPTIPEELQGESRLDRLEQDMSEIKGLLIKLAEK